ncbi:MAG: hypothetical protein WA110_10715, partial [Anaerolineaceae bacterium]
MPELLHCLSGHDLGFLRIVAEIWGVACQGKDTPSYARSLGAALTHEFDLHEMVSALPEEAKAALVDLKSHGGALPWSVFTRKYG